MLIAGAIIEEDTGDIKVKDDTTKVAAHFLPSDQFFGFLQSSGPDQVTCVTWLVSLRPFHSPHKEAGIPDLGPPLPRHSADLALRLCLHWIVAFASPNHHLCHYRRDSVYVRVIAQVTVDGLSLLELIARSIADWLLLILDWNIIFRTVMMGNRPYVQRLR